MSPEQRGCCKVDYKADVYSAGVILLELCYPVRTWCPVPHVLARPHADPLLCSQMSTHMERVVVLSALQRRELPRSLAGTAVGLLILRLTADSAAARANRGCPAFRRAAERVAFWSVHGKYLGVNYRVHRCASASAEAPHKDTCAPSPAHRQRSGRASAREVGGGGGGGGSPPSVPTETTDCSSGAKRTLVTAPEWPAPSSERRPES